MQLKAKPKNISDLEYEEWVRKQSPNYRLKALKSRGSYENGKCKNMEGEISFWKEKSQLLASKFFYSLQGIRTESSEIKGEMRRQLELIQQETAEYLSKFLKAYKNVIYLAFFLS